jgi:hypothetical protein
MSQPNEGRYKPGPYESSRCFARGLDQMPMQLAMTAFSSS